MTFPEDPDATSVITWSSPNVANDPAGAHANGASGASANGAGPSNAGEVGRHHAKDPRDGSTGPIGNGRTPDLGGSGSRDDILPAVTGESVTCPECGTIAHVTLNRRESLDFCRTCDYPLFWAPQKILRGSGDRSDESLRRLPGQSGRATIASVACPHCSEQNALDAVRCIRCGGDMHPVEPPPPPAPAPRIVAPPPPPAPVPEPESRAWLWLMLIFGGLAVVAIVVLVVVGTIKF